MKELWIELEQSMSSAIKKAIIEAAKPSCAVVLAEKSDVPFVKSFDMCVASQEGGDITLIDEAKLDSMASLPKPSCFRLEVKDRTDEGQVLKAMEKKVEYVAISCPDWKIIPIENLIARTRGYTKLLVQVLDSEEAKVALDILELGVDGVILKTGDVDEIVSMANTLTSRDQQDDEAYQLQLVTAVITSCRPASVGARVCIDLCDAMVSGEGMLLGSSSAGLFLIQAEVYENPHVEPRPFRVNAGPVSHYVLVPGNTTRYLSELRAGDETLIVDREGRSRSAMIGRIKIERRPLMLIEAELGGTRVRTIAQNAETIRFITNDGSKSVVELQQGDEVLVYHQRGGRHFGVLVEEETIIER